MDMIVIVIDAILLILFAIGLVYTALDFKDRKDQMKLEMGVGGKSKTVKSIIISVVFSMLDTIGIGCYAPMTACFKIFKVTRDKYIPGTLMMGCYAWNTLSALIYIQTVDVEPVTLATVLIISAIGSYAGGFFIYKLDVNKLRIGMGAVLVIVALVMILGMLGITGTGGESNGVDGVKLLILALISFALGILTNIGIGVYAPLLAVVTLLGMGATYAYPVMMGCSSIVTTVAAIHFAQESRKSERPLYDRKTALYMMLTGWIGVLIGYSLVSMMSIDLLKVVVVVVVFYTAAQLLYQGIKKKADKVAEAEDAEMGLSDSSQ